MFQSSCNFYFYGRNTDGQTINLSKEPAERGPGRQRAPFPTKVLVCPGTFLMGNGGLDIAKGNLNQIGYRHIIDRRLLSQAREWFPDNDFVFMHGGAPFHSAGSVKTHLDNQGILECLIGLETVQD